MRSISMCRLNKEFTPKFPEDYVDEQTPEEDQRTQRPKYCNNDNKDEDISAKVNNVNNENAF